MTDYKEQILEILNTYDNRLKIASPNGHIYSELADEILASLPSEKEIAKGVIEEWVKEGDKDIYPWNDDMKALFGSLMYFLSKEAE